MQEESGESAGNVISPKASIAKRRENRSLGFSSRRKYAREHRVASYGFPFAFNQEFLPIEQRCRRARNALRRTGSGRDHTDFRPNGREFWKAVGRSADWNGLGPRWRVFDGLGRCCGDVRNERAGL